jgi:hypothetical protein
METPAQPQPIKLKSDDQQYFAQWRANNKDKIKAINQTFYQAHKNDIVRHCDVCDKDLKMYNAHYHDRSVKHVRNLAKQNE